MSLLISNWRLLFSFHSPQIVLSTVTASYLTTWAIVSAKNILLVEEELKRGVRNVLIVLLCRCSQCFSEWENDCGCLKSIKLGGVPKIVLHNANYPEGSDTAMRAFLALPTPCTPFFTVRVVLKGAILLDNMFSVSEEQRRLFCSAGEHVRSGGNLWRQWEGVPTLSPVAKSVIRQLQRVCFCSCMSYPSKRGKRRHWNHTLEGWKTFIFSLISALLHPQLLSRKSYCGKTTY